LGVLQGQFPLKIVRIRLSTVRALHRTAAARLEDHVGQREAREVLSHVVATSAQTPSSTHWPRGRKRHPCGFAEVTRDNRSVDRRDDLGQRDALSRSRQYVAAADTTLGAYETDASD